MCYFSLYQNGNEQQIDIFFSLDKIFRAANPEIHQLEFPHTKPVPNCSSAVVMHLLSCILGQAIMRTSDLGHRLPALLLLRVSHPTGTKGQ